MTSPPKDTHPTGSAITLRIQGIGNVPSFKNSKQIVQNPKTKRPMLITDPKKRKWMNEATRVIESQLRSCIQTCGIATPTAKDARSWIASSMPLDDSWVWVKENSDNSRRVSSGEEGAIITIERID